MQFLSGYKGNALLAGLAIALVEVLLNLGRWAVRKRSGDRSERILAWYQQPSSRLIFQGLLFVWSLGTPFVALFLGIFSTQDIGIPLPDWQVALPWMAVTLASTITWIGWLWGRHWVRHPAERPYVNGNKEPYGLAGLVTHVLGQEGYLASARGALIPLLGSYWGVWTSVILKIVITLLIPQARSRLKTSGQRDLVFLAWTSDLVTGALFVLTGSILVTAASRLLITLVMWALANWLPMSRTARVSE